MKKINYYIIGIILLVLVTSCSSTNISKEDISKVKNISYDDVVKNLSNIINDFLYNYDYYTVSNLEFVEDKLAIDNTNEVKKFNNIKILLDIEVDLDKFSTDLKKDMTIAEKDKAFKELTKNTNKDLLDILHKESTIEYSKVGRLEISYADRKNKLKYSSNINNSRDSQTMITLRNEKSEGEKLILEEIFKYIKEYKKNYELKRFGTDNNILIIEFHIYTVDGIHNQEIEKISKGLFHMIMENENTNKYINDEEVKSMKIIFNKETNDMEPIIFEKDILT
ncbi:hypothetical protein SAMN02745784_01720 [Tissierella praeacuta DSM 18095]|uniref:Lipoprotein n=1 Tax=Tissierella praeacuta DSM 18095 TaxID=1123404 RepID=A0A1M4W5A8_9FIRM|nr:hypothetical protein [Tissierella praeacuta]SHE76152.1 hypothetical protein SAMN02745784_01720 [Tissierella praeacuta DSM 18095]SUP00097.1 Uncharacterised protein [Tissierella praeacuta]